MTEDELEEKFNEIAQECIEQANKVQCSVDTYVGGLKLIISELQVALDAAKE